MHRFCVTFCVLTLLVCSSARLASSDDHVSWPEVSSDSVEASIDDKTVLLKLGPKAVEAKQVSIPRLSAPIRSIGWLDDPDAAIRFWPEQEAWIFTWKALTPEPAIIQVVFDRAPVLPADCPVAEPAGDNSIMLHAYQATTFGEKLRFEPQWYKNTVGYWTVPTDFATWKLNVPEAGTYSVAVLQGCGKGQGGSDAVISLRQDGAVKAELPFKTIDTGHFQNFRWNHLGLIELDSGEHELRIAADRIAKNALFDVRSIHLVKQADR